MAKKSKKTSGARRPSQQQRSVSARPAGSSSGRSGMSRSRSAPGSARIYDRPKTVVNLQPLRILTGVLGLLCLAGAVAMLLTLAAPYSAGIIVTLVLLGVIMVLSLFTAARPEPVVDFFRRVIK